MEYNQDTEHYLPQYPGPWSSLVGNTNGHGLTRFAVHLIEQGIHLIYGSGLIPRLRERLSAFIAPWPKPSIISSGSNFWHTSGREWDARSTRIVRVGI